jgi:hypothetical protein
MSGLYSLETLFQHSALKAGLFSPFHSMPWNSGAVLVLTQMTLSPYIPVSTSNSPFPLYQKEEDPRFRRMKKNFVKSGVFFTTTHFKQSKAWPGWLVWPWS